MQRDSLFLPLNQENTMHAVNIVWLLSCSPHAWLGITQSLPDIDRQFSLCFPLMQIMMETYDETPGDVA